MKMKYNKSYVGIGAAMVIAVLLSASLFTAPMAVANFATSAQAYIPRIFNTAFAANGSTHNIEMSAETLPNGQFGYKMIKHEVVSGAGTTDITSRYDPAAVIPGPTLFVREGDLVNVQLANNNNNAGKDVGFDVPGLFDEEAQVAPGQTGTYSFAAGPAGTYEYRDRESAMVGLFGAIIVDKTDGSVQSYVDGGDGSIVPVNSDDLDREYVLFMVGSTFWGTEISADGSQTPLWTNPTLGAGLDDLVRFHVLSVGPAHTFHLHAHRWLDPDTSNNIIDTKLMKEDVDTHSFTIKAGDGVGPGDWQYHCHVFAHMEAGMHGNFKVYPSGAGAAPSIAGASPYGVHPLYDPTATASPGLVTFEITDEPGKWFKATTPLTPTEQSLVLARPGDSVNFVMSQTNTVHTITSLLWPTGAAHFPMDEVTSYKGGGIIEMSLPGLYVFTCKVHPYMFGGVIVDDPDTRIETDSEGQIITGTLGLPVLGNIVGAGEPDSSLLLDLGDTLTLVNGLEIPTGSDLALRLAATFFKATDSANWKDYRESTYNPSYPAVPVKAAIRPDPSVDSTIPIAVTDLDLLLELYFDEAGSEDISGQLYNPEAPGVGEVWVNTQFEHTTGKTKPGTATAVDTATWKVTKKVALPEINMNNPHNMWTDRDQTVIYQTEWFDNKLTTFDRQTGALISQVRVGESPAHVMTRADNDDIHVTLNGEEGIAEIFASTAPSGVNRIIATQGYGELPTHPHAHWMTSDGQKMVTPNTFTGDTTLFGFDSNQIESRTAVGVLPIATGMTPDDSKYYVANLLGNSLSVVDVDTGAHIKDINLIADYNPFPLQLLEDLGFYADVLEVGHHPTIGDFDGSGVTAVGALPIQTPVSPDGRYVVTANTLSGTITVVDTSLDEVVAMLACDPGCHGVQFGAKDGGGYYAYVSSKFSNAMIIVDMDTLSEAGRVLLVADSDTQADDAIVDDDYTGMGGQGVLAIPNVYNGWVQKLPEEWRQLLTEEQLDPVGQ